MPVPPVTTARMRRSTVRAVRGLVTVVVGAARRAASASRVRRGRRPRSPTVAAIDAICRVVACTRPWPMAVEPSARSSPISPAAGIVDVAAPGTSGGWSNPKRRAVATRRRAPTATPIGAKTELQDSAKAWTSVPPQDSPLAFWSSTPSMRRGGLTG